MEKHQRRDRHLESLGRSTAVVQKMCRTLNLEESSTRRLERNATLEWETVFREVDDTDARSPPNPKARWSHVRLPGNVVSPRGRSFPLLFGIHRRATG